MDSKSNSSQQYVWRDINMECGFITDMSFLFEDTSSFNDDISSWDVSNAQHGELLATSSGFVTTSFTRLHRSHTSLATLSRVFCHSRPLAEPYV